MSFACIQVKHTRCTRRVYAAFTSRSAVKTLVSEPTLITNGSTGLHTDLTPLSFQRGRNIRGKGDRFRILETHAGVLFHPRYAHSPRLSPACNPRANWTLRSDYVSYTICITASYPWIRFPSRQNFNRDNYTCINRHMWYTDSILKLLPSTVISLLYVDFIASKDFICKKIVIFFIQGFLIKIISIYTVCCPFFAPWLGAARVLKESSIKGKKKNRRAPGYLSGAAITSVTSIPGWTRQKFYEVIFSERKGYVHSYIPVTRRQPWCYFKAGFKRSARSPGWPGGSRSKIRYGYVCRMYIYIHIYTCRLASGYFLLQVTRLSARIVDEVEIDR